MQGGLGCFLTQAFVCVWTRSLRSTCSCHAYNSSTGASSPGHRSLASRSHTLHNSSSSRSSKLGQPAPSVQQCGTPASRANKSRAAVYCSASRSGRQSEEWFYDDPLPSQAASVSEVDIDSVQFLTGSQRYVNLFTETEEDAAAQLDRRWRSLNGSASTSSSSKSSAGCRDSSKNDSSGQQPTELILQLVKYGSGWGEEIFPRASLVQRPIEKKQRIRNRSSLPDPWAVSALAHTCLEVPL